MWFSKTMLLSILLLLNTKLSFPSNFTGHTATILSSRTVFPILKEYLLNTKPLEITEILLELYMLTHLQHIPGCWVRFSPWLLSRFLSVLPGKYWDNLLKVSVAPFFHLPPPPTQVVRKV
jgi:hypothetical protein